MAVDGADVVIIGAGAGGATLGGELAEAGAKVVFLEAGKDLDVTYGSPHHFAGCQMFLDTIRDNLFWHEEYTGRNWRTDMGECSGGGTTTYAGVLEPSTPRDYHLWPFSYEEFLPYIELTKERFHVYRWPLNELSHTAQLLHQVSGGLLVPIQGGYNREPYFEWGIYHDRCRKCRCCILGCRYNAKANALTVTLPKAKYFGAEVRQYCWATRLNLNSAGTAVESVTYLQRTPKGLMGEEVEERTIHADYFVLASGSMMTPMLLHWSGPGGQTLANSSGQVGKNLRGHFFRVSFAVLNRDDLRTYQGNLVEVFDNYANYDKGYLLEFNMVAPPTYMGGMIEVMDTDVLVDWLGLPFKRFMRNYGRMITSAPLCRSYDEGFTENSVMPHPELKNRYHDPLPVVTLEPNATEAQWVEDAAAAAIKILDEVGADPGLKMTGGIDCSHKVGTCRMGTDPSNSVTDLDGKCWDLDNVWIADGSLFPAPLLANCAFIIYALAYKISDSMIGRPSRMASKKR